MNRYDDWNLREDRWWKDALQCIASIGVAMMIFSMIIVAFVAV